MVQEQNRLVQTILELPSSQTPLGQSRPAQMTLERLENSEMVQELSRPAQTRPEQLASSHKLVQRRLEQLESSRRPGHLMVQVLVENCHSQVASSIQVRLQTDRRSWVERWRQALQQQ